MEDFVVFKYTPNERFLAAAEHSAAEGILTGWHRLYRIGLRIFQGLGVAAAGIAIGYALRRLLVPNAGLHWIFVAALLWSLMYIALGRLYRRDRVRRLNEIWRETHVTLTPGYVRMESENSMSEVRWPAIDSVVTFKGGFSLVMGNTHLPIPYSGVQAEISPEQVIDQLDAWREAAR